jgi:tetratricopeptide (TPR) repeat protein
LFEQDLAFYPEGLRPTLPDGATAIGDLHSTVADAERAAEALGALDRLSLIKFAVVTRTFSLHRLVQAAGRDLLGDAALPWVQSAVTAADAAFPAGRIEFAAWPTCQRLLAHARAALDGLPTNGSIPSAARLANQCGLYLHERAAFVEAEPLLRRALAIDETSCDPDYLAVAIRLNNLALLLKDTNRLAGAEPLMRRALPIAEASYGPGDPRVAPHLSNLAGLLSETNRLAEAEPLYRRALAIAEAGYGPDHPDVANCHNNLACLLQDTNRLAEAEPLMRRALAIDEASYGPQHPSVAKDLNNLAVLLQNTNRLAEAEPLMRRALAID